MRDSPPEVRPRDKRRWGKQWLHTDVGAVIVRVTVLDGESLRQAHAEEISATANLSKPLGMVRALRSWTGAAMGAALERFLKLVFP